MRRYKIADVFRMAKRGFVLNHEGEVVVLCNMIDFLSFGGDSFLYFPHLAVDSIFWVW